MNLEYAKRKTNSRINGYGEIGECTLTPLTDSDKYHIDLCDTEGRRYQSIIEVVYTDVDTPLKAQIKMEIKGFEFKINKSELHLR